MHDRFPFEFILYKPIGKATNDLKEKSHGFRLTANYFSDTTRPAILESLRWPHA